MKEKTAINIFKGVVVIWLVIAAWLACDILDSYAISWTTFDKHLEQSKKSYDLHGKRLINNGWGE